MVKLNAENCYVFIYYIIMIVFVHRRITFRFRDTTIRENDLRAVRNKFKRYLCNSDNAVYKMLVKYANKEYPLSGNQHACISEFNRAGFRCSDNYRIH